jgi:hypothetical protein
MWHWESYQIVNTFAYFGVSSSNKILNANNLSNNGHMINDENEKKINLNQVRTKLS